MQLAKSKRDQFLAPLQVVGNIVERRTSIPILSNIFISKTGGTLSFIASDSDMQITTWAELGGGAEEGAITVQARKLLDIVRNLPEAGEIKVEMTDKGVTVASGKSRFKLQTMPAADFPVMAAGETQSCAVLPQKSLRHLLEMVHFAMACQDIRYYLNGVLLRLDGTDLIAVATDGHRLAYVQAKIEKGCEKREFILPRKAVGELLRQLEANDDEVHLELAGQQLVCRFANTELVSKLVDGKFPDYNRVIPSDHPYSFEIDRMVWYQALHRVALVASEKFRGVSCTIGAGVMRISANNAEQEEGSEELDIEYTGEAMDIAFNVQYVLDVLSNLKAEKVKVSVRDAAKAILIAVPERDDFKYVVMPMRA